MTGDSPETDELLTVSLPSQAVFVVETPDEQRYLEERVNRYLSDNHFVNISDYQDLDRMVTFELFIHRWSLWLSRGMDYYGDEIDQRGVASQIESWSSEVRLLKKNLGIDKPARDKARGDDSVVTYLMRLRDRAQELGVMRNAQFDKALELFQQMKALIGFYDRTDEVEHVENQARMEDIFEWLRTVAIPEFDAIDQEFRRTNQRHWVRAQ